EDPLRDSEYLRRVGLIPNVLDLLGPVDDLHVLDAGCGQGWLFAEVTPAAGWECDVVPMRSPTRWNIRSDIRDVRKLEYPDASFHVVVSSLVLMWVDDMHVAFREAFRVTKPGGRMIVALTHPYFHTNGQVEPNGDFRIDRALAAEHTRHDVLIAGLVG